MPFETESEEEDGIEVIYSWDIDDPENTRKAVFRINREQKIVEFFPRDEGFPVERILFEGFRGVPPELNEVGYIKTSGVQYYLARKLGELNVTQLKITRQGVKALQKAGMNRPVAKVC